MRQNQAAVVSQTIVTMRPTWSLIENVTLDDLGDERLSVSSAQHMASTSSAAMLDARTPCSSGDVAAALRDVTGIAFPAGASRDLDHRADNRCPPVWQRQIRVRSPVHFF